MSHSLLLADDSPTISKILGMALANESYEIRSVLTAEDALRELRANPPYFFLVDLSLPEKNGYEFARLIKSDVKLRNVRVVLLASAFEPVDEGEYATCGADGMVKKPFDPSELRATLVKLLDAPQRFPDGVKVTGSLSGFLVSSPEDSTAANILMPNREATLTNVHNTFSDLETPPSGGDADSILAGLVAPAASPASEAPPPFQPAGAPKAEEFTNATVFVDFADTPPSPPAKPAMDSEISKSFSTPPGGTAIIDLMAPSDATPSEPLSANAQALAAFFDAEIKTNTKETPAPAAAPSKPAAPVELPKMPEPDPFDASLSSIEWDGKAGPAAGALNEWSSSAPPRSGGTKSTDAPPPFQASKPSGGSAPSADMMFDTGGSSFRFSEDYIHRITKSFNGEAHETVPTASVSAPFFPQQSDDAPKASSTPPPASEKPATGLGGGAWTESDVARIEKIVREEVQMVVREVAEKIAWEVIPELAENLIRKELDRVLKEIGN